MEDPEFEITAGAIMPILLVVFAAIGYGAAWLLRAGGQWFAGL
jgi:hypothetical protein